MCVGIIRNNSLVGGRAQAKSNPGHWAHHALLHMAAKCVYCHDQGKLTNVEQSCLRCTLKAMAYEIFSTEQTCGQWWRYGVSIFSRVVTALQRNWWVDTLWKCNKQQHSCEKYSDMIRISPVWDWRSTLLGTWDKREHEENRFSRARDLPSSHPYFLPPSLPVFLSSLQV